MLLVSLVLGLCLPRAVLAQNIQPPEPYQPTDGNGVNLATGTIGISTSEISIGQSGAGGLSYSASFDARARGWRHNTWGGINRKPDDVYAPLHAYTVTVMGRSVVFEKLTAGTFGAVEGYGTLTLAGGIYTFTALDGTIATFNKGERSEYPYEANEGVIQQIVRPNGEIISFTYLGGNAGRYPLSVSNNLGYQIHFEYAGGAQQHNLTVTALNNGIDACAPTATSCSFSQNWPSLTLAALSSGERTATDNLGHTLRLGFDARGQLTAIARPTQTTGSSRSVVWSDNRVSSVSDGVGIWTYTIPVRPSSSYNTITTVRDPNLNTTSYAFAWEAQEVQGVRPELRSITDSLNNTTAVLQDGGGVREIIYPEGDGIRVIRNTRGDVETVTRRAKPGSPTLPDQITTATYGDCSTPIRCGRPTSVTDARGNVTTYTYDAAGNLLTETGPAPTPGAARPQTRYTWEQRYAWYRQNGSSAITRAASPVWVQTGRSQCMTGTTC